MSDIFIKLGRSPLAKNLIRKLGLPIPLPTSLTRDLSPWTSLPLQNQHISFVSLKGEVYGERIREVLAEAGAVLPSNSELQSSSPIDAFVCDASRLQTTDELEGLYTFLKDRLSSLKAGGRVVIVGSLAKDLEGETEAAACTAALLGFVKSLAKELGRKGATAQLLTLADNPDKGALAAPLCFLLSSKSAFINGQGLALSPCVHHPEHPFAFSSSLTGKTALVTGAARGIGAAICRSLAREGAHVIGVDRPEETEQLRTVMTPISGTSIVQDLLAPDAIDRLMQAVHTCKGIDILVNNAGITRDKTLARMPKEAWQNTMHLNLHVPLALTKALSKPVVQTSNTRTAGAPPFSPLLHDGGRVIMLSSIAGIAGNAGQTNYAASKAGLIGFVKAYAPHAAVRGITVNAIAPGFIETEMTKAMPLAIRELGRRFNTLNQAGIPDDVAELACFLALPAAYAITGQTIRVCGQNLLGA